jgi:hypothetical protein
MLRVSCTLLPSYKRNSLESERERERESKNVIYSMGLINCAVLTMGNIKVRMTKTCVIVMK